jgi:hypothetical protein
MKPLFAIPLLLAFAVAAAHAQGGPPSVPGTPAIPAQPGAGPMASMPMHHPMPDMTGPAAVQQAGIPTEPGQAAFGAIQQIVEMLQADPRTDWSKVDVDALRRHLIDMDEVTLWASTQKETIENGLRIKVTGSGRTLEAIRRMVPDHAREIDGRNGWTVRTTALPEGVELIVTAVNPADVTKIRALGFMGIMVQGGHHQLHHLAMARGEPLHSH